MERLDHNDQSNILPGSGQLFGSLQRQQAAHAEAAKKVRALRLKVLQFGDVIGRHFFQSSTLNKISVEALSLKGIDRLIRFQMVYQTVIIQYIPAKSMHQEKRRLGPSRPHGN